MIVVYRPVHRLKAEGRQPEVFVGQSMGFLLSLRATDFEIKHVDGRSEVHLSRNLTTQEALELGQALVNAARGTTNAPWITEVVET